MLIMGAVTLCAALALFPLLIRIVVVIGLLLACLVYVWLAAATVMAVAIWLARKAQYR